jgi:hypothetical protein
MEGWVFTEMVQVQKSVLLKYIWIYCVQINEQTIRSLFSMNLIKEICGHLWQAKETACHRGVNP